MARSRYKFFYLNYFSWKGNLNKIKFFRWTRFKRHRIFSKNTLILPIFVKQLIELHKGHQFKKLIIDKKMIGHKFGRFILTRKPFFFPIKVKKKK